MKTEYTNKTDTPLLMAAWMMSDQYDYVDDPKYISATSLMRPIKEQILSKRIDDSELIQVKDISDLAPSSLGNAVHNAVEQVWTDPHLRTKALLRMGYSAEDIQNILVNPTNKEVEENPDAITLYFEQRKLAKVLGYTIGGKYDAILSGVLHDIKTTSAYAWVHGTRDEDFIIQGSIYRWLNPDKVTEDFIRICFYFTDWSKAGTSNPNYPDARTKSRDYPLWSIADTEKWVKQRIKQRIDLANADEEDMPDCTDEDVWLSETTYRYFSDPTKVDGRATRVFKTQDEATDHWQKAGKGIVLATIPTANKCQKYCNAFSVCKQKDNYAHKEE